MNVNITKIICLINLVLLSQSFFSKNHKRCIINGNKSEMSTFPVQRLPLYSSQYNQRQFTRITEKIEYQDLQFIYDEYIAAGGSGQVFRIEEQNTGDIRILKRFFQENQFDFQQENFIMKQMEYSIKWHKQDNNPNKNTLASYPSKDSASLIDLEVQHQKQYAVLLYKICKEIEKAHKIGIIHNDLKMGNFIINSIGQGLHTIQVQLIDWNLASFYTKGYETVDKKGTTCYYPPEALIRTNYITPAIDIWSLAVVYFTFITNKKPFTVNCKDDNFEAILSLVSSNSFLEVFQKYNMASLSEVPLIQEIKRNKFLYEGISVRDRIPEQFEKIFDEQMIDLFQKMLQVDPEYRLTIGDVLKHPYFDRIKKLPKMYVQKNKGKQKKKQKQNNKTRDQKHAPANNLVQPQTPSLMREQNHSF